MGTDAITVLPVDKSLKEIRCAYDRVYPAEEIDDKDVDDNCMYRKYLVKVYLNYIFTLFKVP